VLSNLVEVYGISKVLTASFIRVKGKAVPLHAMKALGGEEV
jgi:hypothetical protein